MALTIEDGTIVSGADSWVTVAEWEAYATNYGHTVTGSEAEKEVTLRKAQRAISTRYTLKGELVSSLQTTSIPRYWHTLIRGFAVASDDIPQAFKDAQCEMAWAIHEGADPLAARTADNVQRGALAGDRAKAGPVETEKTYSESSGATGYDALSMGNYTAVKSLLAPYLLSGSGQVRVMRG